MVKNTYSPSPPFFLSEYCPIQKKTTFVDFIIKLLKPEPALDIDPAVFKRFQPFSLKIQN